MPSGEQTPTSSKIVGQLTAETALRSGELQTNFNDEIKSPPEQEKLNRKQTQLALPSFRSSHAYSESCQNGAMHAEFAGFIVGRSHDAPAFGRPAHDHRLACFAELTVQRARSDRLWAASRQKGFSTFSKGETATILAAMLYWREEVVPHGRAIMRPYFKAIDMPRDSSRCRAERWTG